MQRPLLPDYQQEQRIEVDDHQLQLLYNPLLVEAEAHGRFRDALLSAIKTTIVKPIFWLFCLVETLNFVCPFLGLRCEISIDNGGFWITAGLRPNEQLVWLLDLD
jgi:hypothetical protein